MATRRELIEFIRFQLGQLGAQNRHHDFEHVARHIARNRIASNILPATGPVARLGDQGRDAETFLTYMTENPLKGSSFVGLVSDEPVAFACTIQEADLPRKIRQDVAKITASGIPVASIHYFTVADIASGVRHNLQSWARDEHAVYLEIHDGRYIAETLTDPDLFWIANDFLAVPRTMYPESPVTTGSNWYADLRASWDANPDRLPTIANFEEVKQALRHATYAPERRVDVPFWLDRLRGFMAGGRWDDLHRRAVYETVVASLHQKSTLEGFEQLIRQYFDVDYSAMSIADIHDAAILVTFCAGAIPANAVNLAPDEVATWRTDIEEGIEKRVAQHPSPNEACHILFIEGFLELLSVNGTPQTNATAAVEKWNGLPEAVRRAPLFPLEELTDELNRLSRSKYFRKIAEDPEFADLAHQLDDALAARIGGHAIAEKSHRRANAHHDNDRPLMAVAELRRARHAAYSYETIEIWLESLLYTAELLLIDLGLPHVAKYYAMVAVWISGHSGKREAEKYQPRAILVAARADLLLGNWHGALGFMMLSAEALLHYVPDSDADTVQSVADEMGSYLQLVLSVAKSVNPDLARVIESAILNRSVDADDQFDADEAAVSIPVETLSLDEVVDAVSGQMWGVPFGDLSEEQGHTWQANGITWSVRWKSDPALNAAAEELMAMLQVLALHLAERDAYLVPIEVSLEATLGDVVTPAVEPSPEAPDALRVVLPREMADEGHPVKHTALILGMATQLTLFASLLPKSRHVELLSDLASDQDVLSDAYIALPYRRLYWEMTEGGEPTIPSSFEYEVPEVLKGLVGVKSVHHDVGWKDNELAEFDEPSAIERIARRYDRIPVSIPRTIERLQQSPEFAETVMSLRDQGWKDWHLLLAIKNASVNYWLHHEHQMHLGSVDVESAAAQMKEALESGDWDANHPVPLSEFTEQGLRFKLDLVAQGSELASLELEPSPIVDVSAIREFLARRMKYWDLDAPHDPVFPSTSLDPS